MTTTTTSTTTTLATATDVAPALPEAGIGNLSGPTPTSNWVIPGRLLTGSYPGMYRSEDEDIRDLLKAGVTLIVPLVESVVFSYWPYIDDAKRIAKKEFQKDLKFEYFPIEDLSVPDDDRVLKFIPKLADKIREGKEIVYIHCFSGHGRSGIVVSLLLSALYSINGRTAIELVNECHSHRDKEGRRHSPETNEQCKYVERVSKMFRI